MADVDVKTIHRTGFKPVSHFPRNGLRRPDKCPRAQLPSKLHRLAQRKAFVPGLVSNPFGRREKTAAGSLQAFLRKRSIQVVLAEIMPAKITPKLLQRQLKTVIGLMVVLFDFTGMLISVAHVNLGANCSGSRPCCTALPLISR